jgi:thymidylate kinase
VDDRHTSRAFTKRQEEGLKMHERLIEVLEPLSLEWQNSGVRWALLGRFGKDFTFDNEVDVIIHPDDFDTATKTLEALLVERGWLLIQVFRHELNAFAAVVAQKSAGEWTCVSIDLCTEVRYNGVLLQTADAFFPSQQSHETAWVYLPPAKAAFIYYLLKCAAKRRWNGQGRDYFSSLSLSPLEHVESCFGKHASAPFQNWLEGGAELDSDAFHRDFHRRYRGSTGSLVIEARRALLRITKPTGLFVAITGPDGAGKSTVSGLVAKQINGAFRDVTGAHLYNTNHSTSASSPVAPYALPPRGFAASLAKVIVLIWRFNRLYWVHVLPKLWRHGLFWCDRHYTDVVADPARFRVKMPRLILQLAWKLIPLPHLSFVLVADFKLIQQRTNEVSAAQTQNQVQAYENLCRTSANLKRFDVCKPAAVHALEIADVIMKHLSDRQKRRGWMKLN